MIRNYFKITWRNIRSNKLFTTLNLSGLAIGLCVCILLFASISYQLGFDRMYKNAKNIYRVNTQTSETFEYKVWAQLPNAVGPAMLQSIPQVKSMARLVKHDYGASVSLKTGENTFVEKGLYMADSTVFSLFDFHFIEGNSIAAFQQPKSIVLSQSAKQKLFGKEPATGKIIYVNNKDTLHVSAVYQDLPANSTIDCDMIYNIMDSWMGKNVSWSNASFETYCLLQPVADLKQIEKQATALIEKNVEKKDQYFTKFLLQPLTSIYLYSADIRQGYSGRLGNISTVKILLFLSLLVLAIACINYMNLATARSQKRAKGVGVNKVMGAGKRQMLLLFYVETAVFSLIAIFFGYLLAFLIQPLFYNITGVELNASTLYSTPILISLLVTWFLVTLIAGSYPAFSLSRISPLVLMSKLKRKHSVADFVRRGLVVFQFASSIILIIGVLVILQQMNYIRTKNLGYNPKGVLAVSVKAAKSNQVSILTDDLKNLSTVKSVSPAQSIPGDVESGRTVKKPGEDKEGYPVKTCRTDGSIVNTMQLSLAAGSSLPQTLSKEDTSCYVIVNEALVKYLGFKNPEQAIGTYVTTQMLSKAIITGVVKDFHYQSLKSEIGGYIYYTMNKAPEYLKTLLIRYDSQDLPSLIQQVQAVFKKDMPDAAFDYEFLDTHVQNLYISEQHTANTATAFSLLAIFVACLGLFGLAAFTAEQRIKEMGIRKVLGASVSGIATLLSRDFLKLVLVSILIASPIAWWLMNQWLMDFNYRIQMNGWVFGMAGSIAIVIALVTIGFQAIKTAVANPVKSLRTE